ncbi:2-oxo acid dehydrogenase subunit E2 [Planotetraspora kaengkrachanensis]|uniref:Dihydrolipoamide acetyltransferase component of pyruvate dehydrogenase complex n=1 Tax=Planotetraspora kaengkrachanensis TaxID=575193 RepID=A0A8J3M4X5_9ACTN|nr:2-oxo acid dehydrogenase subunit E2 [Planotetraspora kaengkrachanensis]GIG79236.1 dihydrolipoamide acetyltransferase component of pyruvate dehydrogenase complex [Planotetraspora kaengkrachanensis]
MTDIRVPKLNNNDATYVLVDWLVDDGQQVKAGDPIVVLETSKATEELESEEDGFVWRVLPLNADCAPGAVLARLTADESRPVSPSPGVFPSADTPVAGDSAGGSVGPGSSERDATDGSAGAGSAAGGSVGGSAGAGSAAGGSVGGSAGAGSAAGGAADGSMGGPLITAPARALIDELCVDLAEVRALGVTVVRRADVERLAARSAPAPREEAAAPGESRRPATGRPYELPRVQRAVAKVVRVSHATIPAAYTVVKADTGPLLELAARMTREVRRPVGLPELVTSAVARLHADFPLCFATLVDDASALLPDAPHVGVTIDAGEGLYVPVIHDAARRSVKQIATRLMEYRLAALTGDFREDDLTGANIAVTLHHDGDVTLAVPLIFPGHACALAVTSPQAELRLDGGEVVTRTVVNIGMAYDHRLVNGRDAALFLRALKALLESPQETFG